MGKTALVWGANGISGIATIEALLERPASDISTVIAASRRPPLIPFKDDRVKFVSVDLLSNDVEQIAGKLNEVGADKTEIVFAYAYIEKSDPHELETVNMELLQKSLDSTVTVAGKNVKHVVLQTGYKWYSVHLGPPHVPPTPFQEDAPRGPSPNFYYVQVDFLIEHAKKHNYAWTEVRPNTILGVSTGFMNQAVTTAIYAAVQKFKGEDLIFPGNTKTWDRIIVDSSTAINNARFQVWCTDEANRPKTANEAFNINDGEPQKLLGELWTELGRHLGMKVKAPDAAQVKTDGPTGQWARTFSLVEWSKKPENGEAWKKLVETHGGDPGAFEDAATFAFADFTLGSTYHQHGSIEKARKAGWTGSVDSAKEGYIATLERMQELGTLPKI